MLLFRFWREAGLVPPRTTTMMVAGSGRAIAGACLGMSPPMIADPPPQGSGGKGAAAWGKLAVKHFNEKQDLLIDYAERFDEWTCHLAEGFNLLLYGFGSKRPIMAAFMQHLMAADTDAAVVEVLGFSPHFAVKDLLLQILQAIGSQDEVNASIAGNKRSFGALAKHVVASIARSGAPLILVVHNVEGQNLRNEECQAVIVQLAALASVHVVATADNASVVPLLWDCASHAKINWHYLHVPTFCSYEDELMYQDEIAFEENDGRRLQAAAVVLGSLTQTARSIFRQLVEHQLVGGDEGEWHEKHPLPQPFPIPLPHTDLPSQD